LHDFEKMDRMERRKGLSRHMRQVAQRHEAQEQQAAARAEDARAEEHSRLVRLARYHEERMDKHEDGVRKAEEQHKENLKKWKQQNEERIRARRAGEAEETKRKLEQNEEKRQQYRQAQLQMQKNHCGQVEGQLRELRVALDKQRVQKIEDAWEDFMESRNAIAEQWDRLIQKRVFPKQMCSLSDLEIRKRGDCRKQEGAERLELQQSFRAGFALKWERMKMSRRQAGEVRMQLARAAEQMLADQRAEERSRQRRQQQHDREVEHAARVLVKIEQVQGLRQQRMEAIADHRAHAREDRRRRQFIKRSGLLEKKKMTFEAIDRENPPVNWAAVMDSYRKPLPIS